MAVTSAHTTVEEMGDARDIERATDAVLEHWYLLAIAGAVSAIIGILVLAHPEPSVKLLGAFLGIDLLIAGLLLMLRGPGRGSDSGSHTAAIVLGTLALVAGVIVLRNPGKSVALLAIAFGLYLIVAGALTTARALGRGERRGLGVVHGLVALAAGIVIVAWPDVGLKTLALLIGIALLLQGAFEIAEALLLRAAAKALRGA
jgi:uncharacterized membrane protein HdeD (DUF308 family)